MKRPEAELLWLLARPARDAPARSRIECLISCGVDWDAFVRIASRHGVAAIVYHRMLDEFSQVVPAETMARLRDHYRHGAARSIFLTRELISILDAFHARGIDAIPYKGPALGVSAYGDPTLRQFVDLDILVEPSNVWRASEVLTGQGYEPHFTFRNERERNAFLRLSYVQLFTRDNGKSAVELHWGIAPRFLSVSLALEEMWKRLERISLSGREISTPGTEDLILILSVHGAKDLWDRLEWVTSIAALIEKNQTLDWSLLVGRAKAAGIERILLLALHLAGDLLATPLPVEVQDGIRREKRVRTLAADVVHRMLEDTPTRSSLFSQIRFHVSLREKFGDKIRYCSRLAMTTTPVDWEFVRLPGALALLYHLVRPFRLLRKYVASASKLSSISAL